MNGVINMEICEYEEVEKLKVFLEKLKLCVQSRDWILIYHSQHSSRKHFPFSFSLKAYLIWF